MFAVVHVVTPDPTETPWKEGNATGQLKLKYQPVPLHGPSTSTVIKDGPGSGFGITIALNCLLFPNCMSPDAIVMALGVPVFFQAVLKIPS